MNSEPELTFKEKLGMKLMNFPMLRQLLFEILVSCGVYPFSSGRGFLGFIRAEDLDGITS